MNSQSRIPIFEAIQAHVNKNPVSFHVPGHKYGQLAPAAASEYFEQLLKIDATELTGLDDLHAPEGAILEAEELLQDLYHSKKSFFLVNGSTAGNLAMIMAACSEGDIVLVQRNCHKSVLNALRLAKAIPVFLEPEWNQEWKITAGVTRKTVEQALALYPDAKAIVVTYPNYYGMIYDLQSIITLAHDHHLPVLVDEAHGAHFIAGESFPASSLALGADIVVHSAHKTLPAMTMGSFLHVNSHLVNHEKVKDYLDIFQTSSPSYPIMASLDLARNYLATYEQRDLSFLQYEVNRFKSALAVIPGIKVLDYPNDQGDILKITIQSRCGLNGFELQQQLEKLGIFTELADPFNVLFILPLLKACQLYPLEETAEKINKALRDLPVFELKEEYHTSGLKISELAIPYHEMAGIAVGQVQIDQAAGAVCAENITPYPPGIPLFLKGERITEEKLNRLNQLLSSGARFQGGSLLKSRMIKTFVLYKNL